MVIRCSAQTVQYIVRVALVRYRTTSKRLLTNACLLSNTFT